MPVIIYSWSIFCTAFGITLLVLMFMNVQQFHFYTQDVVLRKFSIMEIKMPATPLELANLINGIYGLPAAKFNIALNAIKRRLYVDFIFMLFAYGSTAIICWHLAAKMNDNYGGDIFMIFGFLQVLAWLCGVIENIYLLNKIKPNAIPSITKIHQFFLVLEILKWGIVFISIVCALAALLYFWLTGHYAGSSLPYLLIVIIEIILFVFCSSLISKKIS